ncbi:ABC transporter permease subunit [Natrialba asiatica]|uniref:ABC-2 type transporter n=1 Tax=Natrialba asiatica (strain ATCC 700177 / DSM 12278 / JCM 9576 / FERM P-10747 / NBRC 102637 / 172P1) TaxID=29540 RepID=M0AR93_NATA1|nr:ABC transporter permease subunit [Natrialba asiatica]ELZ00852.1 ABC-2 type transporter [Natrialba asiatica DSM 12278]
MSWLTVAKKDFKGARRSKSLWAAAVLLGLVAVVLAYGNQAFRQTEVEAVQGLFRTLTQILAVLLPIIALTATYMAIAGEREGGGIKFLLSLPNTRRDVFTGKLLSRLAIVASGVVFMYIAASSVSLTKHGVFPLGVIAGTLLLTILYGSVFVSIAVAVSAAAASRSRAIANALASYFVLVILYVFPDIQVKTVVQGIHTSLLGMESNPDLYNAVQYTSPFLAYQKAINLVVPNRLEQQLFRDSATNLDGDEPMWATDVDLNLPVYLTDEFSLVILAFWLVVPLLVGFWAFKRTDLE